jgi:hypothetical protein
VADVLPETIVVGPVTFDLSTDEKELLETCRSERSDLLGYTNCRRQRIVVSLDQGDDSLRDTLLHECFHAVFDMVGLTSELGAEEEEKLIRRIATPLLDVLQRNPLLVKALVGG